MYHDVYAHIYQKIAGFKVKILQPNNASIEAYLSLEPSTRSTYDMAMRDATINGLLTAKNKEEFNKFKPSQIFLKDNSENEKYIIQSINKLEFQQMTANITAIKQNCFITIKRYKYNEETGEEEYQNLYEDIIGFVSMQNQDEKNYNAGLEEATRISVQIPKRDINGNMYSIEAQDRLVLKNIQKDYSKTMKVESVDCLGVPGVSRIYGVYETRTGD